MRVRHRHVDVANLKHGELTSSCHLASPIAILQGDLNCAALADRRLILASMQPHERFHAGFLIQLLGFVTPTYIHSYVLIEAPDGAIRYVAGALLASHLIVVAVRFAVLILATRRSATSSSAACGSRSASGKLLCSSWAPAQRTS